MNERIQELKHQASLWCDQNIPEQFSEETNGYGKAWEEKFAELIVRECAHLVGGYTKENEFGTDVKEAYEEITKHFGVEE